MKRMLGIVLALILATVGVSSAQTEQMGSTVISSTEPYVDLSGSGGAVADAGIDWEISYDPNEGGTIATDGVALIHYLGTGYVYDDLPSLVIPSVEHAEANYVQYSWSVVGGSGNVELGDAFGVYNGADAPFYAALVVTGVEPGMIVFRWMRDFGPAGFVVADGPFSGDVTPPVEEGIAFGSQTLIYQGYGLGDDFDFSTGMMVPDTVDANVEADFTLISNEGTNIGNEGTQIPGPMLLLLPESDLGSVTSIPPLHG
jgi:hypothetical protein